MKPKKFYLKNNIQAEPLINNWYAWHLLINPVTYALIMKNLHIPIMESYLQAPDVHANITSKNKLYGGPFIDFHGQDFVSETKLLLATAKQNKELLALADAVYELNNLLIAEGIGSSLEKLYRQVPDALKGYVELVYDMNNNPSFRLFEGLLFENGYYKKTYQKFIFSAINSSKRPFVLSTPRFADSTDISLDIPFNSSALDDLFRSRKIGLCKVDLDKIIDLYLSSEDRRIEKFWNLFSDIPNESSYIKPNNKEVRIRYFGHACVLIETDTLSILVDPLINYDQLSQTENFTYTDLPDIIDYVLITHAHQDHVMLETLLQIRHKVLSIIVPKNNPGCYYDPSLKRVLEVLGFTKIIELSDLEKIQFENGNIIGVPFLGEHGDLNIASKLCYLINVYDRRILFLADSNNLEPLVYQNFERCYPTIDIIFLGMECEGAPMSWLYGPLFLRKMTRAMDQSRRLDGSDADKAYKLIRTFNCHEVYIYAMGQEPWLSYITSINYTDESKPIIEANKLIKMSKENQIHVEKLYLKKEIILQKRSMQ